MLWHLKQFSVSEWFLVTWHLSYPEYKCNSIQKGTELRPLFSITVKFSMSNEKCRSTARLDFFSTSKEYMSVITDNNGVVKIFSCFLVKRTCAYPQHIFIHKYLNYMLSKGKHCCWNNACFAPINSFILFMITQWVQTETEVMTML